MKKLTKKIFLIIIVFIIAIGVNGRVRAASSASANISISKSEVEEGKEIEVIVSVKDISVGEGINVLKANLQYDSNVLEYVKVESENDWQPTFNAEKGILVNMYMSGLVSKNQNIAKFIFKVKDGIKNGNSVIKLTNIEMSNDIEKVSSNDSSITIKNSANTSDSNNTNNNNKTNATNNGTESSKYNASVNNSGSDNSMPYTGIEDGILFIVIGIAGVSAIISFYAYRKYKGV